MLTINSYEEFEKYLGQELSSNIATVVRTTPVAEQ